MNPYSIIENYFIENKKLFSSYAIFEAGFGDLGQTLDLFYKTPFKNYFGVNTMEEHMLTINHKTEYGRDSDVLNIGANTYDKYLSYCENNNLKPLYKEELYSTFKLKFNTKIEDFITSQNAKDKIYDIGIFSNIFHLIRDKNIPQNILKWFNTNSNSESNILIKVMTKDDLNDKEIFIYNERDIKKLFESFSGEIVIELKKTEQVDNDKYRNFHSYLIKKKIKIKENRQSEYNKKAPTNFTL